MPCARYEAQRDRTISQFVLNFPSGTRRYRGLKMMHVTLADKMRKSAVDNMASADSGLSAGMRSHAYDESPGNQVLRRGVPSARRYRSRSGLRPYRESHGSPRGSMPKPGPRHRMGTSVRSDTPSDDLVTPFQVGRHGAESPIWFDGHTMTPRL